MKDPYEVLGVSRNASMDEIKTAYKELVKKYHPDKYQNNPLSDLAEEKLQEINEAYDALTRNQGSGFSGSGGSYGGSSGSGFYGSSDSDMQSVRNMINSGNLMGAQAALNQARVQDAEWYFLSGVIAARYGRRDEALSKVQTAVSMNPSNMEYRQTLNQLMSVGGQYRQASYGGGYNDDSLCKLCAAFTCFDCLCPCI